MKNDEKNVKAKSDAAKGLTTLFENQLKDIYWAEKALVKALPKMVSNATSQELIDALDEHLSETEKQVDRLEEVFDSIGTKAQAEKCEAMEGLIEEAEEIMKETEKGEVRDAGIIVAAQKVEHYEIATYGSLCVFAETLGENEALKKLKETLSEEKEADSKLTKIAESSVNKEAAMKE
ncbi:MAG: ferritin-like domain-containing protein [Balneolaceae bacterium]